MSLFTVEKPKLVSALERARNAVEKSINIPILENILIERADDGEGLSVRATNLNIEVSCRFEARVDEAFAAFTLPAHRLFDIVKTWPDGREIEFAWSDETRNSVVVKSGRSRFVLPALPAEDFVRMRREPSAAAFTIDAGQLTTALSQTATALSRDSPWFVNRDHGTAPGLPETPAREKYRYGKQGDQSIFARGPYPSCFDGDGARGSTSSCIAVQCRHGLGLAKVL
ncbi:hypothetical protein FJU08_06870 [Martelella alba]|uniref:Beta sliding clamp n=1 Tax=Martelella alba TaxID=2590451 RepID=A0A506UEQ9_9HYPH|nr:hypothetical protein [Martelella alba]TPW31474.1 hypothetical protein FJU08_06870 [Martelella alba]